MTYSALTIGLSDDFLADLRALIVQYDMQFTVSVTAREVGHLLSTQVFHLLIINLDYMRSIQQAEWLAEIRRISFVPIIILSETPDEDIKSMIHLGADMCVSGKRPYATIADLAFAQLRRYTEYNHYDDPAHAETAPFQVGDIYIDPARQETKVCGRPVILRNREFSLLLYFMRNPKIVLTSGQICENAWGMEYTQPIDRAIHELRKQIEADLRQPCYIQTVHRVGYRFTAYSSETCDR